ncbi:hypothetical protein [Flavilitoribacter nigricans]|uniref:Outer membrane protein beta-barrel domain-containing protein n=1 Tax=Flavilitoribacter nigricans (strain ATCC 23147 / DSM 23189 / NBRC 102662 / NCIMB 1420 / SS-2) TaxID=1122177 RepID=A0A2D0N0T5_FLAN2|nr:hypothetical protein [Flavilitoribacter nigricans]PHN01988.1 hypothetical protein CRP01_34345 [Flavilitoribacter nigricans DSM 23189 = NBRC 102662]
MTTNTVIRRLYLGLFSILLALNTNAQDKLHKECCRLPLSAYFIFGVSFNGDQIKDINDRNFADTVFKKLSGPYAGIRTSVPLLRRIRLECQVIYHWKRYHSVEDSFSVSMKIKDLEVIPMLLIPLGNDPKFPIHLAVGLELNINLLREAKALINNKPVLSDKWGKKPLSGELMSGINLHLHRYFNVEIRAGCRFTDIRSKSNMGDFDMDRSRISVNIGGYFTLFSEKALSN